MGVLLGAWLGAPVPMPLLNVRRVCSMMMMMDAVHRPRRCHRHRRLLLLLLLILFLLDPVAYPVVLLMDRRLMEPHGLLVERVEDCLIDGR